MIRINENTVKLTDEEMTASAHFEELLDHGVGIVSAANDAGRSLSPEFVEWLIK